MIIDKPSPHFRSRKAAVDTLVIHYISAIYVNKNRPFDVDTVLKMLCEPIQTPEGPIKISAHYAIDREGLVYRLVDEKNVAWHAGKSSLKGRAINGSCNDFSIGIELFGGDWIEFTEKQYTSLISLTQDIQTRHQIPKDNIVGHEFIAPVRKVDPGKHFRWPKYLNGVYQTSIAPTLVLIPDPVPTIEPSADNVKLSDGREPKNWLCSLLKSWFRCKG